MIEKTFGEKEKDRQYKDRAGVYAIIFDNKGSVAAVRVPEGSFLIGGGIEEGETHEECLKRECLEETGYDIEVKDFICKGNTYFYSEQLNVYHFLICYFYLAELKDKIKEPVEEDHEFEWLAINEIEEKLFFKHQIWAIKQAMRV
jgi:8-oxo-dGTP diphosphatase